MTLSRPQVAETPARILIVEDEGLVAEHLSDLLSASGYEVAGIAESSQATLAQVRDLKPDLILMDVRIKGTMDGIETTAKLRERFDIPVVYLTAHTDPRTVNRAKTTGAFGFLTKPVDTRSLTITIEMAIHKHQADRTIRHQRSWMATILGTMADAMAVIDREGKLQFLNSPAEALTGWTNEECQGMDLSAVLPFGDAIANANADQARVTHSSLPRNLIARRRSGETFAVEGAIAPSVADGVVVGSVITFRDATARNAQDNEIRHQDKMQAIGRLAAGIAHDFNNLLFVILGQTEEMLVRATDDRNQRSLNEIWKAGRSAATITQQLLRFSRKQPAEKQNVDLNATIRDTEELLRRMGGHTFIWDFKLGRDLGLVWADPGQLKQVLMNLVTNARDASPGEGKITLETSNVGALVALSVTDTGAGMSADTAEHLFEPFFTTKGLGSGTGLGLSIVHSIVTDHGGSIRVVSAPGSGATFTIYFPGIEAPAQSEAPVPATILLVEDQENVRRLLCAFLTGAGYHVLEASSGDEAIRMAVEHNGAIDLLISDVMIPGTDGLELARTLAKHGTGMKVILMSGFSQKLADTFENLPPGARFLPKPFTRNELLQMVNAFLPADAKGKAATSSL